MAEELAVGQRIVLSGTQIGPDGLLKQGQRGVILEVHAAGLFYRVKLDGRDQPVDVCLLGVVPEPVA